MTARRADYSEVSLIPSAYSTACTTRTLPFSVQREVPRLVSLISVDTRTGLRKEDALHCRADEHPTQLSGSVFDGRQSDGKRLPTRTHTGELVLFSSAMWDCTRDCHLGCGVGSSFLVFDRSVRHGRANALRLLGFESSVKGRGQSSILESTYARLSHLDGWLLPWRSATWELPCNSSKERIQFEGALYQ